MIELSTQISPHGSQMRVPDSAAVDRQYPTGNELFEARRYYDEHGYVVVRNLVSKELCNEANQKFLSTVSPYKGYIYRQSTANPERHVWTSGGFMQNSILNVQDLSSQHFSQFRHAGLNVITAVDLQSVLTALIGESPTLVQSMYFEGNPVTWAHQDTYYLDSEVTGSMCGAWVATEDISPGAGRFYIYPGSHRVDMSRYGGNFDYAFNHQRYKAHVLDVIRKTGLECRAPALNCGDVLFWNSRTIHGSLPTLTPEYSRTSFTAHYIPSTHRFVQFQSKIKRTQLRTYNGMWVNYPKDQDMRLNRLMLFLETRFPRPMQTLKRLAIKWQMAIN